MEFGSHRKTTLLVRAKDAGLHGVFLQFDGLSNEANAHRGIGNLFAVKLAALDKIHGAGLNTYRRSQLQTMSTTSKSEKSSVAVKSIDRIHSVLFQPLVFTGRDQLPANEDRWRRRYTLAQLAHDLKLNRVLNGCPCETGFQFPHRCVWERLDALGLGVERRSPAHDLHATHGQFSVLLVDTETHQAVPFSAFFLMDRFLQDATVIARDPGSPFCTRLLVVASILRNLKLAVRAGLG